MILIQQTEASSLSLAPTRTPFARTTSDKHEDPMTPAFDLISNDKSSLFAYPAPAKLSTIEAIQKVEASKPKKQREPSSAKLRNLLRVTPAQVSYIVFPSEVQFQPVRHVTISSPSTGRAKKKGAIQRLVGGRGTLMVLDKTPEEPMKWIEPATGVLWNIPVAQEDPVAGRGS
ncbi:proteasome regulatory particle base subunit [Tulasnella sp. 427]|nr:proteasome regulatory particle base subunit [Tulasnella sp. 427]